MGYQLDNTKVLFDWLAGEPNPDLRTHVLGWVQVLADDPAAVESFPVPWRRPGVMAAFVPGTEVTVTYPVAEDYRTVRLLSFGQIADLLDPPL